MATFTLKEILEATGGYCSTTVNEQATWQGVSTDTRTIQAGDLFVALTGETFDGHTFLKEAKKKGATGAIVGKGKAVSDFCCIEVENTLKAYQQLARFHRDRFDIPLVAVTGSSGKTTTKELIAAVLETKYKVLKTEKNFNNEIGLPKTLLSLTAEHEVCVVEMGMRGLGQIRELAEIARPTIGVITNVGTSHIELLGSQEEIAKAKSELAQAIGPEGTLILNEDDMRVKAMSACSRGKIISYGMTNPSTVTAFNLRYKKDGIKFSCRCFDELFDIFLPMIGIHNVYNALAAVAVGRVLGLVGFKINKGLGYFEGIPMRQEIVPLPDVVLLNDTYNANPSSMSEAVKALGQLEGKRKVAILGDMLELGDYGPQGHREIGFLLGEEGYKALCAVGELAKYIAEGAREKGVPTVVEVDSNESAVAWYSEQRRRGDLVLVKGSRGMKMEEIINRLRSEITNE